MHGIRRDIALAWFPFFIAFVAIPIAIYIPNQPEFGYRLSTLAPLLLIAAAALPALSLLRLVPVGKRHIICKSLFFAGVFFLVTDIVAPISWGQFDGEETLREPFVRTATELAVAAILAAAFIKIPYDRLREIGTAVLAVLLVLQTAYFVNGVGQNERAQRDTKPQHVPQPATTDDAALPNVYHVVFDAFASDLFLESIDRQGVRDRFDGFTFFKDNLSNYQMTDASIPSFLSGTLYAAGSFRDWQRASSEGGVRRQLLELGYEVSVYVPDRNRSWAFDDAHRTHTSREIAKRTLAGSDRLLLAHLSAVRLAPNLLRNETYKAYTKGLELLGLDYAEDYRSYKGLSVPLFEKFLDDERDRPARGQYVYVHVILPHSPNQWDESCNRKEPASTNFVQQTDCSTLLMARLTDLLQTLNRYDESLIVFQSDHGYHGDLARRETAFHDTPAEVLEKFSEASSYYSPEGIVQRLRSLLLVKPPGATTSPLHVSHAPTQLLDVPATIIGAIAREPADVGGTSVFDLDEASSRRIHLYAGLYTRSANGRVLVLGQDRKTARLAHISFDREHGWLVHDDLDARF